MLSSSPRKHHKAAAVVIGLSLAGCAAPPPSPGPLAPVYCYRTLADVTCRTEPEPGEAARLVGVYLRDPSDPGWPDWWLERAGALP